MKKFSELLEEYIDNKVQRMTDDTSNLAVREVRAAEMKKLAILLDKRLPPIK